VPLLPPEIPYVDQTTWDLIWLVAVSVNSVPPMLVVKGELPGNCTPGFCRKHPWRPRSPDAASAVIPSRAASVSIRCPSISWLRVNAYSQSPSLIESTFGSIPP